MSLNAGGHSAGRPKASSIVSSKVIQRGIKMAMVAVHEAMSKAKLQSRMILQVHDELVFDVHQTETVQMQQLVKEAMENAVQLTVPMEVEMKLAANWLEAH